MFIEQILLDEDTIILLLLTCVSVTIPCKNLKCSQSYDVDSEQENNLYLCVY
jgi:hypothetical protein